MSVTREPELINRSVFQLQVRRVVAGPSLHGVRLPDTEFVLSS